MNSSREGGHLLTKGLSVAEIGSSHESRRKIMQNFRQASMDESSHTLKLEKPSPVIDLIHNYLFRPDIFSICFCFKKSKDFGIEDISEELMFVATPKEVRSGRSLEAIQR